MSDRELNLTQSLKIEKADVITRAQLDRVTAIVANHYGEQSETVRFQLTAALVQAMATNYLAVVQAASKK